MISVLILTANEEANLPRCFEALRWADDVLVLDSFSTDRTLEVARAHGARVLQNRFVDFAQQRNFGLDQGQLKHPWVLHLDADEVVPESLRDEMLETVRSTAKSAFRVPSKMMFQGRWLKHAGLYPSYQVRLGRRDALRFVQVGHGQREAVSPDSIGALKCALLHYSFAKGIRDWVDKHNRYSSQEAARAVQEDGRSAIDWAGCWSRDPVRRRRSLKQLSFRLPFRPVLRFLYMYGVRLGFLDGRPGFTYCCLLSFYEYLIGLKMREARRQQEGLPL